MFDLLPLGLLGSPIFLFLPFPHCGAVRIFLNPLSPNIHIQILQTDLYTFSLKNKLREFDERSKHSLLGDQFINSHNLIS